MRFQFTILALVLILFASGNMRITTASGPDELTASAFDTAAYSLQSKADAGYVLEIEGRWYVDRTPREYLAMGQRVVAGDAIKIVGPKENDHIVIVGTSEEIIAKRYCARENCLRRLDVPSPPSDSGVLDAILKTAMRLIRGRPERYSIHGVRGERNDLEEAMSPFDKNSLDLSSVFRKMPKGIYYLKLRDLGSEEIEEVVTPQRFDWNPQQPSALFITDLRSGVYEVRLMLRKGNRYEPSLSVWTLISSKGDFDRLSDSFRQAVRLTRKWETTTTEETRRAVLRAYLDELAESIR
jgi:hypothetical protein